MSAMLRFGFDSLGFKSARADVDPNNTRSLQLLDRLGFKETGRAQRTFKIGDDWFDSIYLTLEAADFKPS
jgi:RimJ/RimL family protein N-acetyltransferase